MTSVQRPTHWNFDWNAWRFISPWEAIRGSSSQQHIVCKKCWTSNVAWWFAFCILCMNDILEAFYEMYKEMNNIQ